MGKFTLKQCAQTFVAATVLTLSGCGGGGGDSTPPATGTAYYVDSAVSGVNYKCGSHEGITGTSGEFTFEVGTSCTFYLGDITLRNVDAALLVDGATVYETDVAVAQVLQSLDADANLDNGITINTAIVQALADADITALPEIVAETEAMLQVIEESGGTVVSEEEAKTHVMETLLVGKTVYVTYINETGEKIIEEIVHGTDGISTSNWTEDGAAKTETINYTITGYTIYTGEGDYHVAIEFTADYILLEDYDGGEADGTTKLFFDRAAMQSYLDSLEGSGGGATPAGFTTELLAGKTFYIINENSTGGETCILEQIYTATTVTQKEWVYHSADNWTSGCQEDYGEFTDSIYTIEDGIMKWEAIQDLQWQFELNEVLSDRYIVTIPDGTGSWYFSKDKVIDLLEGSGGGATLEGFTTDYLNGRTLYNAYFETDTNEWELSVFSFTDTAMSAYQDSNPSVIYDGSYSITSEGYISYVSGSDGPEYIKAVSQTTDYMQLCWSDEISHLSTCTGDDEYFYFDYQKARDFVDAQNAAL